MSETLQTAEHDALICLAIEQVMAYARANADKLPPEVSLALGILCGDASARYRTISE